MQTFEIPLTPVPQTFNISLNGRSVTLTIRWKETVEGGWSLDIDDAVTGLPLAHGIPMVTGVDLLAPFKYLGISCGLMILGDDLNEATRDNLGHKVKFCMVTEE